MRLPDAGDAWCKLGMAADTGTQHGAVSQARVLDAPGRLTWGVTIDAANCRHLRISATCRCDTIAGSSFSPEGRISPWPDIFSLRC